MTEVTFSATTNPSSTEHPGWMRDEVASAGRENLDVAHVGRYDAKENAGASEEVELLNTLGLLRGSTVVEFGAGTGQFTLAAAPLCTQIIAVDVSTPMLEQLRSKVATSRCSNIEVIQAGFLTYERANASVDMVYSRYALHHLPDFWKGVALSRIFAMLRPGGVFRLWDVVYNFEPSHATDRIESWCATGDETIGTEAVEDGWGRWELEEHVRDEHSTFTWILEAIVHRVGFVIEAGDYSNDGIFAKYILRRPA
jgi:ubiquinone/menaquinone biosynthesis C-methylase UbiE